MFVMRCSLIFLGSMLAIGAVFSANNSMFQHNLPNVYVGAQLAYAQSDYDNAWLNKLNEVTSVQSTDNDGLAGRVYLGYTFNQYLAGEMAYALFSPIYFYGLNDDSTSRASFLMQSFEFYAKGMIPLKNVTLFGKTGLAWVHRNQINEQDTTLTRVQATPALAAGVNLRVTPHIDGELSYSYYFPTHDLESTQYGALGLVYKFF